MLQKEQKYYQEQTIIYQAIRFSNLILWKMLDRTVINV